MSHYLSTGEAPSAPREGTEIASAGLGVASNSAIYVIESVSDIARSNFYEETGDPAGRWLRGRAKPQDSPPRIQRPGTKLAFKKHKYRGQQDGSVGKSAYQQA